MSAAALTPASPAAMDAELLRLHRDDGPIDAEIGHGLGPRVPLGPLSLVIVAALPGLVALAVTGDDPPRGLVLAAAAWAVLVGGISSGRPLTGPVRWTVPPALRAIELGGLVWIAHVAGDASLPAVFVLGCVLAYHHYDTVYGARHRRQVPPRWLQAVAGGWDGRLLVAALLLLAGALPAGFYVAAALLAPLFAGRTIVEWRRIDALAAPGPDDALDEEEEEDEAG